MSHTRVNSEFISRKRFQPRIVIIFGLVLWLCLFLLNSDVRFYSGAVLEYFAGGYSDFKPLFAIVWLLACAAVLGVDASAGAKPRVTKFAAFFVATAQITALLIHICFSLKYDIGLFEGAVISTGRENSSNQLVHIHASKGLLYLLLRFMGIEEVQTSVDPGRAYAELLPFWLFAVQGLIVLAAAISLLLSLRNLYRCWPKEYRVPLAVVFAISSATAIRCTLDGGPFDWTNLALAPVLFLLLLPPHAVPLAPALKKLFFIECFSFSALWLVHFQAGTLKWQGVICNSVLALIFVVTAGLAAALISNPAGRLRMGSAFAASLVLLCTLSTNTFWSWGFRRAFTLLDRGDKVYIEDYYDRFSELNEAAREGSYVLRRIEVTEPMRMRSIYKKLGLRIGQAIMNVSGRGCEDSASYPVAGRVIVIEGSLQERSFPQPVLEKFFLTPCVDTRRCSFQYKAEVRGCTPSAISESIVNRLSEVGLVRFIIVPARKQEEEVEKS